MSSARPATVHSVVIWPFVEAITKLGVALPAWAEQARAQASGQTRIEHTQAAALLSWAVDYTGRADLGVLAAEAVEPGHFDLVELAARTQRTVGQGLTTVASLVPILHDAISVKLVRGTGTSRVLVAFGHGLELHPAGYDFVVASLVIGARRQTRNQTMHPTLVRLPYDEPVGVPALSRLIDSQLEFGAPSIVFEFPTEILELPLSRANPALGIALEETARELLESGGGDRKLASLVRAQVRDSLASGAVDATALARKLHMSERTLRRKLDAEGIGLRTVVDEVRRELALEKLKEAALSTDEIATQLGFTTPQAFHRAFRRWTGGTVAAFRARTRS